PLRPPRVRGRRHLHPVRQAAEGRRHHQPPAARRHHGVRALARQALDRIAAEGRRAPAEGAVGLDEEYREVVSGPCPPWPARAKAGCPLARSSLYVAAFSKTPAPFV